MARAGVPARLLLPLALVGAAALAWWLARPPTAREVPLEDLPAAGPTETARPRKTAGPSGTSLDAPPPSAPVPPRIVRGAIADWGALRVRLLPSDPAAVTAGVRVDVEGLERALPSHPLAVAQEDGSWVYDRLPVGRYRVHVAGAGFVSGSAEARVRRDAEATVEIPLAPGAEVGWRVALVSGEVPETVRIALLDGRGVRQPATFLTDVTTVRVSATQDLALPPSGRVLGLRPGPYRLRATSPAGESDEQAFEARLGEAPVLEFRLRR